MILMNATPVRTEDKIVRFAHYDEADRAQWVTVVAGHFYPDSLDEANELYAEFILTFREMAENSSSSADLLREIATQKGRYYVQLMRIFRRYVSPGTSVEMLKRKKD